MCSACSGPESTEMIRTKEPASKVAHELGCICINCQAEHVFTGRFDSEEPLHSYLQAAYELRQKLEAACRHRYVLWLPDKQGARCLNAKCGKVLSIPELEEMARKAAMAEGFQPEPAA
jgi:hypothetical protein